MSAEKTLSGLPRNIEGKDSEDEVLLLKRDMKRSDTVAAIVSVLGLVFAVAEVTI